MSTNPFGPLPPDKSNKPLKTPPPNPFSSGFASSHSATTKPVNPPPKPSFLLNKESSSNAKPSNPFAPSSTSGDEVSKAMNVSASNPFGRGSTSLLMKTSPNVPTQDSSSFPLVESKEEVTAPAKPTLPIKPINTMDLPPPLPPIPPSPITPTSAEFPLEGKESYAPPLPPVPPPPSNEVSTPKVAPPPLPPVSKSLVTPPVIPPVPAPDLTPPGPAPPVPATQSTEESPIFSFTKREVNEEDDPFAIDARHHQLGSKSSKVIENPFAPKEDEGNTDPFGSSTSAGFSSSAPDPFGATNNSFATFPSSSSHSFPVETDDFFVPTAASADPFGASQQRSQSSSAAKKPVNPLAPPVITAPAPPVKPARRPSSDPFALPTNSDPFGGSSTIIHPSNAASVSHDDDFFASPNIPSVPIAPAPSAASSDDLLSHELKAPPPQIDDDPYLIVTNKPLPMPPVLPAETKKPEARPRETESAAKKAVQSSSSSDPFDIPLPGLTKAKKPEEPAKPVDPNASLPLKVLIERSKSQSATAVKTGTTVAATTATTAAAPPIAAPVSGGSTAPVPSVPMTSSSTGPAKTSVAKTSTASMDFSFPNNDPFAAPSSSSDPFVSSLPTRAKTSQASDPFGEDPFGSSFASQPLQPVPATSTSKTVNTARVDDFGIFDKPAVVADDFAVFATPTNSTAAVSARVNTSATSKTNPQISATAAVPPPLPPKRHSLGPGGVSTQINKPAATATGNLLDGDWLDSTAPPTVATAAAGAAAVPKQTVHDGTFDDMDPFSSPVPGDDPFAPSAGGVIDKGNADSHEDMLEKFRLMYGVKTGAGRQVEEEEDEDEEDFERKKQTHDIYDSDFDDDFDAVLGDGANKKKKKASSGTAEGGPKKDALSYGEMLAKGKNEELVEGEILTRLSTSSMLKKDWHDHYYVIVKGVLYLYKTKLDYQYNPQGTNYKKKIPIAYNLSVSPVKAKEYKGFGVVYNFMLEEVMDYGRTNLGKFGSPYKPVIDALWRQLRAVILYRRHAVRPLGVS